MKTNTQPSILCNIPAYSIFHRRFLPVMVLCLLSFFPVLQAEAKTPRALIIGIDIYKPSQETVQNPSRTVWRNLGGCVNDAGAMKDLVITRYHFAEENIRTLFNQEAARERIIAEIRHLITVSEKGDVVFIYYAGHGSQVMNSLSREKDKRDETIVPADAYKGAKDIRDKELAVLFNQLIDKGVILTVIFDSCHSGSAGRGLLYEVTGVRNMEADPNDAADPSDPDRPEERGALILSAAQDFEFAKELADENKVMHGAFTLALLKSLQQNDANAPVENIFSGLQAIMKFYGKTQEPVLAGNDERKRGSLFGKMPATNANGIRIPVLKSHREKIELMGGFAFGLSEGQLLKSINSNDTIEITEMIGANRSLAKIVSVAKPNFTAGALFEPVNWTSSSAPALKVYIPVDVIDQKQLKESIVYLRSFRKSKPANFVIDLASQVPVRVIHYGNNGWWYQDQSGKRVEDRSLNKVISKVSGSVFINIPPEQKFAAALKEQFAEYNNIEIVSTPGEALYSLSGRLNEKNELEYTFIRNNFGAADRFEILPARTNYELYDLEKNETGIAAGRLSEYAFKIARIRSWMMLQPPQGSNRFPFALDVAYYRSGKKLDNGAVNIKDTLSFFLNRIPSEESWNRRKRFVYVFSIDASGAMKLLFPGTARGNVENKFPVTDAMNNTESSTKLFDILVKPPAGNDAYFMLSTEEAISNLSVFQQAGVVTRGPGQPLTGIESILFTGTKSRNKITTPLTWSIEKLVLHINPDKK